ncbi:TPA: restriction endonuclease, partial [Pseudomonas aeruginosa]|nr:restriction endonuclease [Pseudomonas aeruginosa]HCJ0494671.1 restriction endonuclease [Pseudomonas aeruginosa]HCJ0661801.1 restriction endonuclease [Pseudomonas aeruginosa]HEJ2265747.1 restriction endonuclease [Pseudomonas aeruginosa]
MPAVIAENDVSIWDDETGAVYHYPRRYSAILKPGVQVVYYKGKLTDKSFADQRLSA